MSGLGEPLGYGGADNEYGFLTREIGKRRSLLSVNLEHLQSGQGFKFYSATKPADFKQYAESQLDPPKPSLPQPGMPNVPPAVIVNGRVTYYPSSIPPGRQNQRGPVFFYVMARACEARGLHDLEQRYLDLVSKSNLTVDLDGQQGSGIEQLIAQNQMRDAEESFRDPTTSWSSLLRKYRRNSELFGQTLQGPRAVEAAEILQVMADEDSYTGPSGEVARLIEALPQEAASQWSQPGFCEIFKANPTGTANPAQSLADLGFEAVPLLIRALDDRRFTHCTDGGFGRPYVLRVGDVALQTLEEISRTSFLHRKNGFGAQMQFSEIPKYRAVVTAWWQRAQVVGELPVLTKRLNSDTQDSVKAADLLKHRFPRVASRLIGKALLASKHSDIQTPLVNTLKAQMDAEAIPVLKQLSHSAKAFPVRVEAALALQKTDPLFTRQALLEDWKGAFALPVHSNGDFMDSDMELSQMVRGLTEDGSPEALGGLFASFPKQPSDARLIVVRELPMAAAMNRSASSRAVERLLVSELDDCDPGDPTSMNGVSYEMPEIGDLAAISLSQVASAKYSLSKGTSRAERLKQRRRFKSIWRASERLPELPSEDAAPQVNPGDLRTVTHVEIRNRSKSTAALEKAAIELAGSQVDPMRFRSLLLIAAQHRLPPGHCIRIELSRDAPEESLDLTVDLDLWKSGTRGYRASTAMGNANLPGFNNSEPEMAGTNGEEASLISQCLQPGRSNDFSLQYLIWPGEPTPPQKMVPAIGQTRVIPFPNQGFLRSAPIQSFDAPRAPQLIRTHPQTPDRPSSRARGRGKASPPGTRSLAPGHRNRRGVN
ncbi:MAG TPA: HEAT repeat domain-containing protein [Fimbriimonas sp.]|nr:HEAT repeat domain-containing protein [Fimbriimonas sp.]